MKVQFLNYQSPKLALNQRSTTEKKQDLSSYSCQNSFGLISRPDLTFHPSFGMLKKTKLDEYQLACANKFSAPLEKFNTNEDFNSWASKKLTEKTDLTQYKNIDHYVKNGVRDNLEEWKSYLSNDDFYKNNPSLCLIIFYGITSELSQCNKTYPPFLHVDVLSETVEQLKKRIQSNPKENFDFNKMYQNNLRSEYTKGETRKSGDGYWVKINSKENDPENFEENIKKIKALSCKTWCTRSTLAEAHLKNGDFYVYLENNKPKLAVAFDKDEIDQIKNEENEDEIPEEYADTIKSFTEEINLKNAEKDKKRMIELNKIKEKFAKDLQDKKYENILKHLGYDVKVIDEGMLELSKFKQPDYFTLEQYGIDENELFKNVKKITGHADFENSKVKNLGSLKTIGGNANFKNSEITNLGNLETIGRYVSFEDTKIADLGNLKSIGEDADFKHSKITNLGKLKFIGRDADFRHSKITDLGKLKSIGNNAFFYYSEITNLGSLETIGGDACIGCSKVNNLGNLHTIGGDADFYDTEITDLSNLQYIGRDVRFDNAYEVTGNVKYVGENVYSSDKIVIDKNELPFYKPAE